MDTRAALLSDWRLGVVALVALQRLAEVAWSAYRARQDGRAGSARLLPEPGYRWMVLVHGGWLAGCLIEPLLWPQAATSGAWALGGLWAAVWAAIWMAALGLRCWVLASLGRLWSVRLVQRTTQPIVTAGPYAWLRHPNYLAVVLEIAAVPLLIGAWRTALAGSLANLAVLVPRIRREERYLLSLPGYRTAFGAKKRLIPWVF